MRKSKHAIKPEEIAVTYKCNVLKKDMVVKLSALSFNPYGCSSGFCEECRYEGSGVEISVYCECKRTHIIQEY